MGTLTLQGDLKGNLQEPLQPDLLSLPGIINLSTIFF